MSARLQEILAKRTGAIKQHADERAAKAAENRAKAPIVTAIMDDLTQNLPDYGKPGHKVKFIDENGMRAGKPGPRGVTPVLERMAVKDAAPVRVNKGKPPRSARWWENTETEES